MHTVTAYNGTDVQFEQFEMTETGIWFISDATEAEEYGTIIKEVELDISNPLYLTHEMNAYKGPRHIASKRGAHTLIILPKSALFAYEHTYTEALYDVYIVFDAARIKNLACVS